MMPPSPLKWRDALPILMKASRSIWPSRRAAAKRELERMAKLADDRVAWFKNEALDKGGVALPPGLKPGFDQWERLGVGPDIWA